MHMKASQMVPGQLYVTLEPVGEILPYADEDPEVIPVGEGQTVAQAVHELFAQLAQSAQPEPCLGLSGQLRMKRVRI